MTHKARALAREKGQQGQEGPRRGGGGGGWRRGGGGYSWRRRAECGGPSRCFDRPGHGLESAG